jgi:hypothetical protein
MRLSRLSGVIDFSGMSRSKIALGVLLCTTPVFAHHGTGASYDQKRWVKVEGVVTEYLWRNPHTSLYLRGKDASGKTVDYSIEMFSPGQMVKQGYTKTVFKTGDMVVIEVHPSYTHPDSGECLGCKFSVNGIEPVHKDRRESEQ